MWLCFYFAIAYAETRFLYRRRCAGESENNDTDRIGCAERYAIPFEEMLTPSRLWCNATTCETSMQTRFDVHRFECTEQRCVVLLRCAVQYTSAKRAVLLTGLALVGMVVFIVITSITARVGHDNLKTL
jgi:hypothetical protein